jgi:hypothetical protein
MGDFGAVSSAVLALVIVGVAVRASTADTTALHADATTRAVTRHQGSNLFDFR